jgi:hypothetical protein
MDAVPRGRLSWYGASMSPSHPLPATHVFVKRRGSDVVSSFVFDDGIAEARGIAVVMTPPTVEAMRVLFDELRAQSPVFEATGAAVLSAPSRAYLTCGDPISVHNVSVVTADDSHTVLLGFRCVDFEGTLGAVSAHAKVQIKATLATVVALSIPVALGWINALTERSSGEADSDDDE